MLEEDGGETQAIRCSGLTGLGLDDLKEAILALAETMSLKAPVDGDVTATVIESQVDSHRGRLATLLIEKGTLKKGDVFVAGETCWAKVRSMFDEWGTVLQKVGPGFPVQVIGWKDETIPDAGDKVHTVASERDAKQFVADNRAVEREKRAIEDQNIALDKLEEHQKVYHEEMIKRREAGIFRKRWKGQPPRKKELKHDPDADKKINVILKTDVNGSLEVLLDVFDSYPNESEHVQVNVIHFGVGAVTTNDIELATCFQNTFIYTFNLKTSKDVVAQAKEQKVQLKPFNVIYHLVDDLKKEIDVRLPLLDKEEVIGEAVILQEFIINEKNKKVSLISY